ncbi:hypothetical protein ACISU4_05925 [Streptomyces wuyuanensis]|uniref:hypothetical protein n=1 Tax=Streptomyces wuyuanensis TaxID=1196353 RepID=UPI003802E9E9
MDKGIAVVISAGIGVGSTLLGAVGGGALTGRNMRRQGKDQADVEHRHWLRQQRQDAYAAFLAACDTVLDTLQSIASLRESPRPQTDARPLWHAYGQAYRTSLQAEYTVSVVGPNEMEGWAKHLQSFFPQMSRILRDLERPDRVSSSFESSRAEYWDRYSTFIARAGLTLNIPTDSSTEQELAELEELYERWDSDSDKLAELRVGWRFD